MSIDMGSMSATPSSLVPAPRRASAPPSSQSAGALERDVEGAHKRASIRAYRAALDEAAAAECAGERLLHPIEILMDSPRVVRALGIAVPLLANAVWRIAEAARGELAVIG